MNRADPQFLDLVFEGVTGEKELTRLSKLLDQSYIQCSSSFRNRQRALASACAVFDAQGKLDDQAIGSLIKEVQSHFYSLGRGRAPDAHSMAHLVVGLSHLLNSKEVRRIIHSLSCSSLGVIVQKAIRTDLHLPEGARLTDLDVRRAAVAAYLTRLRQNVGSCFGTAPAILIQGEQPIQFFTDVASLIATGRLARVVDGHEFSVPICFSPGVGDLLRPYPLALGYERFLSGPGVQAVAAYGHISVDQVVSWLASVPSPSVTVRDLIKHFMDDPMQQRAAADAFLQLTDNTLLKLWEFTLASFSESTDHFSKWHLYTALGFDSEEAGGIGACIFGRVKEVLDEINRALEEGRARHDILLGAAKGLESRMRSADSSQMGWLRGDYDQKVGELHRIEDDLNWIRQRAHRLSRLLPFLAQEYTRLIPDYFQEVYDPEMHDVRLSEYDDQPAGFRLVYKSGLSDPGLWERIESADEFTRAITNFLQLTEGIILQQDEVKEIDQEVSRVITSVIQHVRTHRFMESAFHRLARRYGLKPIPNPLDNLEKMEKKPWSHISGGTMRHLLATYYSRKEAPTVVGRPVASASDLLIMILDTLKEMPPSITDRFAHNPLASLLMQSPTHAFNLKPGLPLVVKGWSDTGNTYTWVRDNIVRPAQAFVETQLLDSSMIQWLVERVADYLPPNIRPTYRHALSRLPERMGVIEFRSFVLDKMPARLELSSLQLTIDSLLYASVPFVKVGQLPKVISDIIPFDVGELKPNKEPIPASQLQEVCQALYIEHTGLASTSSDVAWEVRQTMRQNDLAMPEPAVFADSNWSTDFFSMCVNPSTGQLELWRTDYLGLSGSPMTSWSRYLKEGCGQPWLIYTQPHEYVRYL